MDVFIKASASVLIAAVLGLTLSKQGKDVAIVLSVAVCCMVAVIAVNFLQPVIDFLNELQSIGNLNGEMISILLKTVGVSLLAEVISLVCADAGNSSLGKAVQLLSATVIIWMSLPLLKKLISLVETVLGSI